MKKTLLLLMILFSVATFSNEVFAQKAVKQSKIKKSVLTSPNYYVFSLDGVFCILEDKNDAIGQFNTLGMEKIKVNHMADNLFEPLKDYASLNSTDAIIKEVEISKLIIYKLPVN